MNPLSKKQLDLQALRGIAIISVLGFHFYPSVFPNGYLGVDLFFVLSGFLMHMLLYRSQKLSLPPGSLIKEFFLRRFKRILPLYSFIIFTILLFMWCFRSYFSSEKSLILNQKSASKALFFISNRRHTEEEDYFEKLELGIDLFTHTWSLSVEIQFYLMCPFTFLVASGIGDVRWNIGFFLLLGIISFIYHCGLSMKDQFNSTFSRIWQFMIGFIGYLIANKENVDLEKLKLLQEQNQNEKSKSEGVNFSNFNNFLKSLSLLLILMILFNPYKLPANFTRPLLTLSSGILMTFSSSTSSSSNHKSLLTFRILTYSGDISYSLYLIHWPVLSFLKLQNQSYALLIAMILSVSISIAIFEVFEKWHLTLHPQYSTLLVPIFTLLSLILLYLPFSKEHREVVGLGSRFNLDGVTDNMTMDDAARKNEYWNQNDYYAPEMEEPRCERRKGIKEGYKWCDYKENGTEFKIAILGNSFAFNHAKLIIQECKHRAVTISLNSMMVCEPLASTIETQEHSCNSALSNFVEFIEQTQPDYAFIITRHMFVSAPFTNGSENLENDEIYNQMRSQLFKMIPSIKKKLFILNSIPNVIKERMRSQVEDIKRGMSFEDISNQMVIEKHYKRGRIRHAALMKECGDKCELIDYYPLFLNTTSMFTQYFDSRGFIYITSHMHLSAHGLEFVRPVYTGICDNLK